MKIYDVTLPISTVAPVYEGDPQVEISLIYSIEKGDPANVSQICCSLHAATHIDAPSHFISGGRRAHELDFDKLLGDCTVVEFDENVVSIEAEHVTNLQNVERILFKTRNSQFWNEPEKGFRKDFTYIAPGAAKILVEKGCKLVGIDYMSVEKSDSTDFSTHLILLENETVIVENLDLRGIPAGEYELICLPLKYNGAAGDGAPARTILRQK